MPFLSCTAKILKKHLFIALFSVLYLCFAFLTYKDYGVTYDEKVEYDAGKYLLEYSIKSTDSIYVTELINDKPENIEYRHLPLFSTYSRVYPMLVNIINPNSYFEWFHLQNLVFGLLLFVLPFIFLYRIYGNGLKAMVGPLLMLITGAISGHIPANPKDIPFAIVILLALTYLLGSFKKTENTFWRTLFIGILIGLSQGLRTVGATVFITYLIFETSRLVKAGTKLNEWKESVAKTVTILLISFFVWILLVPYLGSNFFANLLSIARDSSGFQNWNHEVLYNGDFYNKTERPWHYLFVYTAFQLPLIVVLPLLTGAYLLLKKRFTIHPSVKYLGVFAIVNILLYLILHPVVYNTTRHFIYLLAVLVVISAYFLVETIDLLSRRYKKYVIGVSALYVIITIYKLATLHPYEYIYYNELIGGVRGADQKYELDYWGAAYKESADYIVSVIETNDLKELKVYACDNQFALVYYSKFKFSLLSNSRYSDIILCDTYKEQLQKYTGDFKYDTTHTLVKSVQRDGVSLNNIWASEPLVKYFNHE